MEAKAAGKTCIDCHQGIAHKLPKGFKKPGTADEEE
jgi:nitrate/TMAO reductase-like tetraheme cytochrome c subunit